MALIALAGKAGVGKDLTATIIQLLDCYYNVVYRDKDFNTRPITDIDFVTKYLKESVIIFMNGPQTYNVNNMSSWKNVKFADKLKECICLLTNCTREQLEDRDFKESYLGPEWDRTIYKVVYGIKGEFYSESLNENDAIIDREFAAESLCDDARIEIRVERMTFRSLMQLFGSEVGRSLHPNTWCNTVMQWYKDSDNWILSDTRYPNEAEAIKERGGLLIRINRKGYENTGDHASETALDSYTEFDYVIENDSTIEDLIEKVKNILIKEKIL